MAPTLTYAKALTVYLLIPDIHHPLDAITSEPLPDLDSIEVHPGVEWTIGIKNTKGRKPGWTEFFREVFDINRFGSNSSVSALLIVPHEGRFWAITFGRGYFLLREGVVEERFGLRTALNAIDSDKVRAIDKETFDSLASQARQQAIDDTNFNSFGVNVDRDLLYAVSGAPRDNRLGRRLTGKDALCASVRVPISGLSEYLSLVSGVYSSTDYQKDFPWVDNIYEVRDKTKKRKLDARLVEGLRSGDLSKAWLALPEIVDWQAVSGFGYKNPASRFTVDDISVKTLLESFKSKQHPIDVLSLKRSRVICLNHDDDPIHHWSTYKCLYAEIPDEDDVFLLTNGHWYKINHEIVEEIRTWYGNLEIESAVLPDMKIKEHEDDYNNRVSKDLKCHLFHGSPIQLPANRGPVEFCDLSISRSNCIDLIHVKRFRRSSTLSHLFYQGTNSARLFRTSPEFRKVLSASTGKNSELSQRLSMEPKHHEYRVTFAIASSSTTRLELPLFSKLSLRQAVRELDGLGFMTSVVQISIPAEERLLKKSRSVKKVF